MSNFSNSLPHTFHLVRTPIKGANIFLGFELVCVLNIILVAGLSVSEIRELLSFRIDTIHKPEQLIF